MLLRFAQVQIICAVALAASAAHAANWIILDLQHDDCVSATAVAKAMNDPSLASPELALEQARREGQSPAVNSYRDSSGAVFMVEVHAYSVVTVWFTSMEMCVKAKASLEGQGVLTPPNELR